jgi:hypothetical protein
MVSDRLLCKFQKGSKITYFLVHPGLCDFCSGSLGHVFNHVVDWNGKKNSIHVFCDKCYAQKPGLFSSQEWKRCLSADDINGLPPGSVPVTIRHHGLRNSHNLNCWDAADPKYDSKMGCDSSSYVVDDKTVLAGRESFEGACIGVNPKDVLEKSEEEVVALLEEETKKVRVLPEFGGRNR